MHKMKKVFLVDDEKVIREAIRNSIDWTKEGFDYCGDAPDGEIALPLIEKAKPDIVITDIKMPFMDGLQLSKILHDRLPEIKVIILSGHDEFEYAREAMRVKVSEYCLKPVSALDLLAILHAVSAQIDREESEKKQLTDLKNQARVNASLSRDNFLDALCIGSYAAVEALRKATELQIDLIASYYFILILEARNALVDSIRTKHSCLTFQRNSKETVFIFKGEAKDELEQDAETIRKQLLLDPDKIQFGIGKVKKRILGIAETYEEAAKEKQLSINGMKDYTVVHSEGDVHSNKTIHQFNRNDLIHFLKYGDTSKRADFSQNYSSHLEEITIRTPFYIYYFLMDFTITVVHFIKEQNSESATILNELHQLEIQISWIREYEEILHYMHTVLQLVITYRERNNGKFGQVIQKTKDYIHESYNDPALSLQTIANKVNVSASYLSHMFSQETGQTLIEYLTFTRIERAKEFLKTTNDKTYEIAQKVGYSDSQYFCHTFKKITGMTTKAFKVSMDMPIR